MKNPDHPESRHLKAIKSDHRWEKVEKHENYKKHIDVTVYRHMVDYTYDILFTYESPNKYPGYKDYNLNVWIFDHETDKRYWIDNVSNRHTKYKRIAIDDAAEWCIRSGMDYINYLEWKKSMPTREDIEESFQDLLDNDVIIEIIYGRGNPKNLYGLDDFSEANYGDNEKIIIRIFNSTVDKELKQCCQRLSNLYNVDYQILKFEDGFICIIT